MKFFKKQIPINFDPPAEWDVDPILYVMHTVLDQKPEITRFVAAQSFPNAVDEGKGFMGCDGMTVEQVVRAAIYKKHRRLDYRSLSLHTADSIIGRSFMKMEYGQRFSHQTLQGNIARITPETLQGVLVMITTIGVELGVDDCKKLRSDATSIETNVHYPNEAQMMWDCIRVSCRLLKEASKLPYGFEFRDYRTGAKKLWFKVVNTRSKDEKKRLFKLLLKSCQACLNQIDIALTKALDLALPMVKPLYELTWLRPRMFKAYEMTRRHQINNEDVPVEDKIFSIFEDHTDCIVKGKRKVVFGHKVNFTTGKSSMIFDCHIQRGNWSEKKILQTTLPRIISTYSAKVRDVVADGGQACKDSLKKALELDIKNVVFGKSVGSLQNVTSSKAMATRLKKWRAGIEADISNFKRGLRAHRSNWKGWDAFQSFVMLNAVVFNLKVIAAHLLNQL